MWDRIKMLPRNVVLPAHRIWILSSHNVIPSWKSWLKSTGLNFVAELGKVDQLPTESQGPQGQVWQRWFCSRPCHHHYPHVPLRWWGSHCTEVPPVLRELMDPMALSSKVWFSPQFLQEQQPCWMSKRLICSYYWRPQEGEEDNEATASSCVLQILFELHIVCLLLQLPGFK